MSSGISLGRLEQVDLRSIWLSEPGHFTPWLAQDDNLSLLADTLGMEFELEAKEKGVGPFRADIVCKEMPEGNLVLIENQLERTDHTHLGQLMTYAAGLDAVTIVWIAERLTEEHRAALDWLNEITGEKVSFFGLEIELWRIGDSPIAPKFNMVSKPNDWTKAGTVRTSAEKSEVTETKALQQEYWRAFREFLAERKSVLKPQKASPQHWLNFSIGRSYFGMSATVNSQEERIAVEVNMGGPNGKQNFRRLADQKSAIEAEIGYPLDWRELPQKDASRILIMRQNSNFRDDTRWPEQHSWLATTLEKFDAAFRRRIQELPANYEDED